MCRYLWKCSFVFVLLMTAGGMMEHVAHAEPYLEFVSHIGGQTGGVGSNAFTVEGNYLYVIEGSSFVILDAADPDNLVQIGKADPLPRIIADIVVDGNYVYVANGQNGLVVFDVTDRSNPTVVKTFSGYYRDLYRVDNTLYATGDVKLSIFDIQNPVNPILFSEEDKSYGLVDLFVTDGYAYLISSQIAGRSTSYKYLEIIDVRDRMNPAKVGVYELGAFPHNIKVKDGYAYIAHDYTGLTVLDVRNPENISRIGRYEMEDTRNVSLVGDRAYVADNREGLIVLDVSDPTDIVLVGRHTTPINDVEIDGDYAYVSNQGQIEVLDIRDESKPTSVGSYQHLGYVQDVVVTDDLAYVLESGKLSIVDYSDPTRPNIIGRSAGGSVLAVDDHYAYIGKGHSEGSVSIIDIRQPTNPVQISTFDTTSRIEAITIADGYLFVSQGGEGMEIFDVRNRHMPLLVSHYEGENWIDNVAIQDNYAYVAESYAGFSILDMSDPSNLQEVGRNDGGQIIDIVVKGDYVYTLFTYGIAVADVSDPTDPKYISVYESGFDANNNQISSYEFTVADGHLFMDADSHMNNGLTVLDVRNPYEPVKVTRYGTADRVKEIVIADGILYAAATDTTTSAGLYAFRFHPNDATDRDDDSVGCPESGKWPVGCVPSATPPPAAPMPCPPSGTWPDGCVPSTQTPAPCPQSGKWPVGCVPHQATMRFR